MEIVLDPDKSEEEKQRLTEAVHKEALGDFFGPGLLSASEAQHEALAKLSAETSALLAESTATSKSPADPQNPWSAMTTETLQTMQRVLKSERS